MKILVTGAAGFIGSALSLNLLERGYYVIGIDNHNDYYSTALKEDRLKRHQFHCNYVHERIDLKDRSKIQDLFKKYKPKRVVNLAAQAGVRYSLENPNSYIDSNLIGFANILEGCRNNEVEHLVYASSSSVYGANTTMPFSVHDNVDHPLSLYAATKKANELMAHSYSHLYKLPTTGLRFFTVYGPWDRPDMALQKFAKAIVNNEIIKVYNHGNHKRDFTYIDDIVEGVIRVLDKPALPNQNWSSDNPDPATSKAPWKLYNIGRNQPVNLMDYISALEKEFGKEAQKIFLPIQPGDVPNTWANVEDLVKEFDYKPKTSVKEGVACFVNWFKGYYKL
ncbi:WcaG Nucleoside-diphosphate-sugar epimerases [Candidatus Pelagibacterales bacterium]